MAGSGVNLVRAPHLKEFIFTEKLGSGTYATVYKAYRKSGHRDVVAIKCILKSSLNKASTENLLTEIELLKKLKHDYIVQLKDFLWDDNYIYLIMEYCCGGDLSRFIQSKRLLPENICRRFLQQIGKALQYMRSRNVSHMDLKPQNIILTSDTNPVVKLADFGFAQYLRGDIEKTMLRGSPLYMAPEMICKKKYDAKVDLWSVGVILYECIFGRAPYASKSLQELIEKVKDDKPIVIPCGVEISDDCRDLLLRLLERDPSDRISYEEFFRHPFLDLDHMPASDSIGKAILTIKKAVKEDNLGNIQKAIYHYCKALDYFVPAIKYEKDPQRKQSLRLKVKKYMSRAEELKQAIRPQRPPPLTKHIDNQGITHYVRRSSSNGTEVKDDGEQAATNHRTTHSNSAGPVTHSDSHNADSHTSIEVEHFSDEHFTDYGATNRSPRHSTHAEGNSGSGSQSTVSDTSVRVIQVQEPYSVIQQLVDWFKDIPSAKKCLAAIQDAKDKKHDEDYSGALHGYEEGLGGLLKVLKSEPKGKRKELLQKEVRVWMSDAERIKEYVAVQDLNTTDTSEKDEQEEQKYFDKQQCCVQ